MGKTVFFTSISKSNMYSTLKSLIKIKMVEIYSKTSRKPVLPTAIFKGKG